MDKFSEVKKEIEEITAKSRLSGDAIHAKCVLKWVLKLKPDADEELKIAAFSHDIERGLFPEERSLTKDYNIWKEEHSIRSAKAIEEILTRHGFTPRFIEKVRRLVRMHEVGGDADSDTLMDADSLAFFDKNLEHYYSTSELDKVIFQIKYKYNRMSEKSKEIAKKFSYDDKKLHKLFREIVNENIIEKAAKFAKPEYLKNDSEHQWQHVSAVMKRALEITVRLKNIDFEVLKLAVIFHDINYEASPNENDENLNSVKTAEEFLKRNNYPKERINTVKEAILDCSTSHRLNVGDSKIIEGKILFDADKSILITDEESFREYYHLLYFNETKKMVNPE